MSTSVFQPIVFGGQYRDGETAAFENDGATIHRPGIVLNGFRSYDPFTGAYLQIDPLVDQTWKSYLYTGSNPVGTQDATGLAEGYDSTGDSSYCAAQSIDTIEVAACLEGEDDWTDDWFGHIDWACMYAGMCAPSGCVGGDCYKGGHHGGSGGGGGDGGDGGGTCGPNTFCPQPGWWDDIKHFIRGLLPGGNVGKSTSGGPEKPGDGKPPGGGDRPGHDPTTTIVGTPPPPKTIVDCHCECAIKCEGTGVLNEITLPFSFRTFESDVDHISNWMCGEFGEDFCIGATKISNVAKCKCLYPISAFTDDNVFRSQTK